MLRFSKSSVKVIPMVLTDEYQIIATHPIFDQSKIEGLATAITTSKAKEFSERYIESLKEQGALIVQDILNLDYTALEFNTHKLSSGSGTFGHMYLHHLFLYIEKYAMDKEIAKPFDNVEGVDLLKEKIERSINEIETYIESL